MDHRKYYSISIVMKMAAAGFVLLTMSMTIYEFDDDSFSMEIIFMRLYMEWVPENPFEPFVSDVDSVCPLTGAPCSNAANFLFGDADLGYGGAPFGDPSAQAIEQLIQLRAAR